VSFLCLNPQQTPCNAEYENLVLPHRIEALLKLTPDLKTRLEMLKVIVDRIETVYFLPMSWVDGLTNCALSTCVDLSPEDVPALIEVVQKGGVAVIQDMYDRFFRFFLSPFSTSFHQNSSNFLKSQRNIEFLRSTRQGSAPL
jgi:hypothetical protein